MTIVYEVNIKVADPVLDEFNVWLDTHIMEVLAHDGFINAQKFNEILPTENTLPNSVQSQSSELSVIIHYDVKTLAALENYLLHHAQALREKGIAKFGEYIAITRRILTKSENSDE